MSSGFVKAGANPDDPAPPPQSTAKDELWRQAQSDLEAARKRRQEQAQKGQDGKSLYEVLQANKAAKQEAFEESIKLKNQFQSLNEDDVDFLDAVASADRDREAKARAETKDQLDDFRRKQEQAEQEGGEVETKDADGGGAWAAGTGKKRKRKGGKEGLLKGVKLRKAEGEGDRPEPQAGAEEEKEAEDGKEDESAAVEGTLAGKRSTENTPQVSNQTKIVAENAAAKSGILGLIDSDSDS